MSKVLRGIASIFSAIFSIFKAFKGGNWVMGVLMLFSLFGTKKKSVVNTTTADPIRDSPTYSWDGIQSNADVDVPIPIIFGKHAIGGNVVNTYVKSNLRTTEIQASATKSNYAAAGVLTTFSVTISSSSKKLLISYPAYQTYVPYSNGYNINNYNYNNNGNNGSYVLAYFPLYYKLTGSLTWIAATHDTWLDLPYGTYDIRIDGLVYEDNIKAYTMALYNESTGNVSAQTLFMDVALSVGEITSINKLWVNNQRAESFNDYVNPVASDDRRIRIKYSTDNLGSTAIPEANANSTITKNSTVYTFIYSKFAIITYNN